MIPEIIEDEFSDSIDTENKKPIVKKLKLTNAEQHILNKIKYDNDLNNNYNDNSESDIFIKKSSKR